MLSGQVAADAIYSWSVFEHIPREQIPGIMEDLYALLPAAGLFFLQIEPLYFSPFGSHLRRFIDTPWAHLDIAGHPEQKTDKDYDPKGSKGPAVRLILELLRNWNNS